jgi:hypothetical protein
MNDIQADYSKMDIGFLYMQKSIKTL